MIKLINNKSKLKLFKLNSFKQAKKYSFNKSVRSMENLFLKIKNVVFLSKIEGEHNLFYSPYHKKVYKIFGNFFEKNKIFK